MTAALAHRQEDVVGWAPSLLAALLLHGLLLALVLLADLNWQRPQRPQATGLNLDTRLVDASQVQQRLQQTRNAAQQNQREQQAEQLRAQRAAEREQALQQQREREQQAREQALQEQALAAQQREAEAEREARELAEQQRLQAQAQQRQEQAERERQQALAAQRQRDAERRRQELEALRARELEQQRLRDQQLQQELEQLRQQRQALAAQSAATQQQLEELGSQQSAPPAATEPIPEQADTASGQSAGNGVLGSLRDEYIASIAAAVRAAWVRPPTALDDIVCRVAVLQIPGGEVIEASIASPCNADAATRRSIVAAVQRNDLPYQGYESVFERRINFTFTDK
ncbi:MAG: cell envelope integrity protein TolA [Gammaproteobacteria bacterium]|nr:cell envelope integrity protein TolA [Gammaproteobacteria bacterium]